MSLLLCLCVSYLLPVFPQHLPIKMQQINELFLNEVKSPACMASENLLAHVFAPLAAHLLDAVHEMIYTDYCHLYQSSLE